MARKRLATALKGAVTLAAVGYLVAKHGGNPEFVASLRKIGVPSFALGASILVAAQPLVAARWKLLLESQGGKLPWRRAMRLVLVAQFFNVFLPTTVGGDVARFWGARTEAGGAVVAASLVVERFVGLGCLLAIGLGASVLSRGELAFARASLLTVAAAYALFAAAILFARVPRWIPREGTIEKIRTAARHVRRYRGAPGTLVSVVALSLAWQGALVCSAVVLSEAMGGAAPARALVVVVPLVQLVAALPVSLGGHGIREAGWETLFRVSDLDPSQGLALGVAVLAISLVPALVGAVIYWWAPLRR
jgi:uncharacterized membrane protein YbhN (UPF0104 family)